MSDYSPPKRFTRWMAVIFMTAITLIGFIGTPVYIYMRGITASELSLFFFYLVTTSLAITVGYHRYFSHRVFKTGPIFRFLLLFFGAGTFQKSALRWASQHRQHHQFTDTELDPHNSKRGFFFCHVGWIMFYKHNVNFENVKDLAESKLVMHQHKHYNLWSVTSGLVIPMALGFLIGHPLGAFIMTFCLRISMVLNMAFFINSSAHMVGDKQFDPSASAGDNGFWAILTNGEGYHSFHHKFPNDYRNGHLWYHWDPSKWMIFTLSRLGIFYDLKRTSDSKIKEAALAGFQN